MIIYKHPVYLDIKQIRFQLIWLFTPLCALDLLIKGKIIHGLLGWIPLFAIIWCFKYKSILSDVLEKKGYIKQ